MHQLSRNFTGEILFFVNSSSFLIMNRNESIPRLFNYWNHLLVLLEVRVFQQCIVFSFIYLLVKGALLSLPHFYIRLDDSAAYGLL